MVLGSFEEGLSIASKDASHEGIFIASEIVIGIWLRHLQARGVHVPPQHDLSVAVRFPIQ